MKIYSIEEIVKATNNLLLLSTKNKAKKNTQILKQEIPINIQNIIKEAEMSLISSRKNNGETSLDLKKQTLVKNKLNSVNYNIKIRRNIIW